MKVLTLVLAFGAATLIASASSAGADVSFTRHSVSGLPVSLAVPAQWQEIDVPAEITPAVVKRLVARDPGAAVLASPYAAHAGVRFIGNEPPRRGHFAANVILIVQPLPRTLSLREWFFAGSSAAMQYAGTTTPTSNNGTSGLHYQSTKVQKYGTVPLLTDIYAFAYHGRVFDFTYTSLAADAQHYLPTFAASGQAIRFTKP